MISSLLQMDTNTRESIFHSLFSLCYDFKRIARLMSKINHLLKVTLQLYNDY